MNRITINTCPLCNSNLMEHTLTCRDYYASGQDFEIARCKNCGFKFTQNFPAENEIGAFYETSNYISHSDTKKGLVNKLYHVIREKMLHNKANLVTQASGRGKSRLLDIGSGTGYFPHTMRERGWNVEAIEKSSRARQFAHTHFGMELKDETALDSFPPKSFDAITLWHVMEHLEHLNETWKRLHELISDKGILVIAVPNCSSYDAEKYKEMWAAYDVPRHLWHFTPDTIQQFAKKHHFTLSEQHPMPYDAFYISIMSERYKHNSLPFFRGMLTGTKAWMASIGKPELSSSLIYIFKKENDGKE